jgi:hypothetical protein
VQAGIVRRIGADTEAGVELSSRVVAAEYGPVIVARAFVGSAGAVQEALEVAATLMQVEITELTTDDTACEFSNLPVFDVSPFGSDLCLKGLFCWI